MKMIGKIPTTPDKRKRLYRGLANRIAALQNAKRTLMECGITEGMSIEAINERIKELEINIEMLVE